MYLILSEISQDIYRDIVAAVIRCYQEAKGRLLSRDQIKCRVRHLTGLHSRESDVTTAPISTNPPGTTADVATTSSEILADSRGDHASVQPEVTKPPKQKRKRGFRPSNTQTARCASQYCCSSIVVVFIMSVAIRGLAEHEWTRGNHGRSKVVFEEYFRRLTDEQTQVCRTEASNDLTNVIPQELKQLAGSKMIPTLIWFWKCTDTATSVQ